MFVSKVRDNGERFVTLAEDVPAWLHDAVVDAHDGEFPNDWRYDTCRAICESLIDASDEGCTGESLRDSAHQVAEELVDVYNADLARWLAGDVSRGEYVNEWATDYGWSSSDSVWGLLAGGQTVCLWQMADALVGPMVDAFDAYVAACDVEELDAHDMRGWWVHGCPEGPIGGAS